MQRRDLIYGTKGRNRKFNRNSCQHIYQRSKDKGVIFYRNEDYLILLSYISTCAKKLDISILAICFMTNHLHILISETEKQNMSLFVDIYTSAFAKAYNREYDRKGALFSKRFGSANKTGEKAIRNCIIYINNNPCAAKMTTQVESYRWNFLSVIQQSSDSLDIDEKGKRKSQKLMKAKHLTDSLVKNNLPLNYNFLKMIYKGLDKSEKEMIQDYIINSYSPIDQKKLFQYYENYQTLLRALYASTGSEYDINEERNEDNEDIYEEIHRELLNHKLNEYKIGRFHLMNDIELKTVKEYLEKKFPAKQTSRYLHIK